MMFALDCIQAHACHKNFCPAGITTHGPWRRATQLQALNYRQLYRYLEPGELLDGNLADERGD